MSATHQVLLAGGGLGYQIPYSLRFRAANSANLSRTFGSPTDGKKFTLSWWMKRGTLTAVVSILSAISGTSNFSLQFSTQTGNGSGDFLRVANPNAGATYLYTDTAIFRDPSAWYHFVFVFDSANATAGDRAILYVNGTRLSATVSVTLNATTRWNENSATGNIGFGRSGFVDARDYYDGHMAEFHSIDGQALTPSSFGQTTGSVWVPKKYSGTYGTNGFYLKFADATTTTTIGNDSSGNANNWTTSGISVTSGVTFDQMTDTPTTNFCVLNPLIPSAANISWANLRSGTTAVRGTINALLANSYWEVTAGGSAVTAGTISDAAATNTTTVTANKVFGFRLTSAGTLDYINITDAGSWTNITSGLSGQQFPYGITAAADWSFGQRAFVGTVPSGYAAVSTAAPISAAVTLSGSFTGNAAADGPVIWTNGNPATLTINGNGVTFGTHADKTAGGFKLRTSSASYNASGTNNWTATAGNRFVQSKRPNNGQVNP
jgi:hypothetical protein